MRTPRSIRLTALAGALAAGACATGISGSADSISRWEKARTADPKSETAQRSLGIAYFKANRYDDARGALAQATALDPKDGVAALYLGLTAEAQNDLSGAQKAYETYLEVGRTRSAKNQIRNRLEALKIKRIQAEAKQALAREAQLAATPGPRNTVAVMPFTFTGSDTSLKPIERGFAELVTTDLSRVSALTVVERERIQALLDEIALQQNGIEAGTGVRAGKIIGAGRMVAGSIQQQGSTLQTDAFVTDMATTQPSAQTRDSRALEDLFTMEKQIVLGLVQNMGITLSVAERNAIEQRPTRSLAAFLAFSRGLELSDRGQFDAAGRQFDNALRLDPSFGSAAQKSQEAKSAATGSNVTANSVESSLRGSAEGATANAAVSTSTSTTLGGGAGSIAEGLNPSTAGGATAGVGTTTTTTPTAATGTGATNPTSQTAKVSITIKKP